MSVPVCRTEGFPRTFTAKTGKVLSKPRWLVPLAGLAMAFNAFHNMTPIFPATLPSSAHPFSSTLSTSSAAQTPFPEGTPSVVLISWERMSNNSILPWSFY